MMKKNMLILFLMLLISLISTVNLSYCGDGDFKLISVYWGSTQPIEVTGGSTASLTIILRYEGRWNFNNLIARLKLPSEFKTSDPSNIATIYYKSAITPGTIIQLEYQVYITPQTMKGKYISTLELEYFITNYGLINESIQITLEVSGKPNVQITITNETIVEGKQTILLNINNLGDADAYNLKIERAYSSSITINSIDPIYIECIKPNENYTSKMEIYVPSGMKGKAVSISFDLVYFGPRNAKYMEAKNVQTLVNPQEMPPQLNIEISERELYIGRINKVNISLTNNVNSALKNLKLTISTDAMLKVFGFSTIYIEELKPGQKVEKPMEIYVPLTTTATGTITLSISYYDAEKQISRSEAQQFIILLRGAIEITLTDIAVIPSSPKTGSPFSITLTITNVGTSTAYATYATPILEGLPIEPFGSKSVYIGNIDTNLPTTFTLNLQLLNTTLTQVKLPITLRYMDNLRKISEVTFTVTINISPATTTTTTTQMRPTIISIIIGAIMNPITIVAIIAVLIGVLVFIMRRRRK
ncbi:MAG: hypothetical protein QXI93_00500 [Candidatus Methanomethylicia archaeon]